METTVSSINEDNHKYFSAAQFKTINGPVLVRGPGIGDFVPTNYSSTKAFKLFILSSVDKDPGGSRLILSHFNKKMICYICHKNQYGSK